MFRKNSSFMVKLSAIVLAALMIVGIVPVNALAQNYAATVSENVADNTASPDEAPEISEDTPVVEEKITEEVKSDVEYNVSVTAGKRLQKTNYKLSEDNSTVTMDFIKDIESVSFSFGDADVSGYKIYLDSQTDALTLSANSVGNYYKAEGSKITVCFSDVFNKNSTDATDTPKNGRHTIIIKNSDDVEVAEYIFVLDNYAPRSNFIKYNNKVSKEIDLNKWFKEQVEISFQIVDYPYYQSGGVSGNDGIGFDAKSLKIVDEDNNVVEDYKVESGQIYKFTASKDAKKYKIEIADSLGNKRVFETAEVKTDNLPPVISDISYSNASNVEGKIEQKWTNKDVVVTFKATDNLSGINKDSFIIVGNIDNKQYGKADITDIGDGKYSFISTIYQKYTIKVKDNAGNEAEGKTDFTKVDKVAPENIEISFAKKENSIFNFLTFGLFSNDDVTATVTVKNVNFEPDVTSIKLFDGENEITSTEKDISDNNTVINKEYNLSFDIKPKDSAYDLKIKVADEAGNETEKLNLKDIIIHADSDIEINKELFGVVVTNVAPDISDIAVDFDGKDGDSEDAVYSGNGTFKATVTDELSGLQNIKVYFNNKLVDEMTEISKTEKITSKEIKFSKENLANGNYTFKITATNNSGKTFEKNITVGVDNYAPEITGFEFKATENGKIFYENHGIYSNSPVEVVVHAKDEQLSAGLSKISLYSNNKHLETKSVDEDGKCVFTIGTADGAYALSAIAEDKFELKSKDTAITADNIKIVVNSTEQTDINKDDFRVVVNNDTEKIANSLSYKGFTDCDEEKVFSGNGKVEAVVKDELSGLKSIKVTVDEKDVTEECKRTASKGRNISETIEYDASALTTGEHIITITAVNNCGVEKTFEDVFYIDENAPVVKSVVFDKAKGNLPFGLYSNEEMQVTVTVDNGTEFSKLNQDEYISLIDSKTNKVFDGGKIVEDGTQYTRTFIIKIEESDTVEVSDTAYNLVIKTSDQLGNEATTLIPDKNVSVSLGDELKKDIPKNFEVVVTKVTPDINDIVVNFDNKVDDVYSGNGTFKTTVKDDLSGLKNIKVYFDNELVEDLADMSEKTKVTAKEITLKKDNLSSGKHTFKVEAINNSGNPFNKEITVAVDNTAPVITGFEFVVGEDTVVEKHGLYSSSDVKVIISADDFADSLPSAGVKYIDLYSDGKLIKENIEKNAEGKFEYILKTDDKIDPYLLSARAIDTFGNALQVSTPVTSVTSYATKNDGSKKELSQDANFRVVVNNNPEKITSSEFTYTGFDKADEKQRLYKGDGIITVKVTDDLSGIMNLKVSMTKDDKSSDLERPDDWVQITRSGDRHECADITFDTKKYAASEDGIQTGKYTIEISVTNHCGIEKTFTEIFYIDKTNPEISNFSFKSAETAADKVLKYLSFGIYSNDDIKVTVTAKDDCYSSGIASVTLKSENGQAMKADDEKQSGNMGDGYTVEKTFTLKNGGEDVEASLYKLTATVTDNFDYSSSSSLADKKGNADFEVVSTTKKAEVVNKTEATGETITEEINKNIWYSGDFRFTSTIEDTLSGIDSVIVTLNGKDITNSCNNVPANTDDNKVTSAEITLDTNNVTLVEGENKFVTKVVNNSGNITEKTTVVYVDRINPEITNFKFTNGNIKGDEKPVTSSNADYGYYFKDKTVVTVTANDDYNNIKGSGVNYISFVANDINDGPIQYEDVFVNDKNEASFTIPANFKGQIYAVATDRVHYESESTSPEDLIVEDKVMHDDTSSISLKRPSTPHKDSDGRDLYAGDVPVTIEVMDTYSGIAKIEYSVKSPYDTGNNYDVTVAVDDDCRNVGSIDGWSIDAHDENLATKMSTVISIANNSNDINITVKITDNAGHTLSKEITPFSIDKTVPTIDVVYDNNDFKTYQNNRYFSKDRTATITVTERNFNKADFIDTIKNTDNVIPNLEGWTTNYNSQNPDATTHTARVRFTSDGDYTFDMTFEDMAANKAKSPAQEKFTLDKTLPTISVSFDNNSSLNNSYYKAQRTATITIVEHNFAVDTEHLQIKVNAFGSDNTTSATAPTNSGWTSNGDTRTTTITFADDGKYSFTVDYKDIAYNVAKQAVVETFYVDKTEPEIKFVDVKNNTAYAGEIAPQVILFDNNYNSYTSFVLERIDIGGKNQVVDLSKSSLLNGNSGETIVYDNFATIDDNDGIYKLSVKMVDMAGNEKSASVVFSVNRFGSTFRSGSESTTELLSSGYTNAESDIVIKETNVNKVTAQTISLTLNNSDITELKLNEDYTVTNSGGSDSWHEYTYKINKENFVKEGFYTLTLSTTDHVEHTVSNNRAKTDDRKCPVSFTVDKTKPQIRISGVEANKPYEEAKRQIKVVCEDANLDAEKLVIKLNGEAMSAKDYKLSNENAGEITATFDVEAIGNDTKQKVEVSVVDLAGNDNENSVNDFILSASLITRFFANTPLVIITFSALALAIVIVLVIVVKKRKKSE